MPPESSPREAPAIATVPAGLVCPVCRSRDYPEFDGREWYCLACDGHTDGDETWVVATYVPE